MAGHRLPLVLLALCCAAPALSLPRPEDATLSPAQHAQDLVVTSTSASAPVAVNSAAVSLPPDGGKPLPPQVRSLHVDSNVQYRYAHTVVSSRIANPAAKSQEVTFSVILPETAFISSFAMEVDGKIYKAYVKEKEEAKQTYNQAVAAGLSAAHVAVSARDSNSFTVSVNVEPENKVSFNLTYEELLNRRLGLYNHVVTLNPGQVVDDLQVRVHIKESNKISKLRVPEFSSGNKGEPDPQGCGDLSLGVPAKCASGTTIATADWKSPSEVIVLFRPTADSQRQIADKLAKKKKAAAAKAHEVQRHHFLGNPFEQAEDDNALSEKDKGLNGQFSVEYDVDRDSTGGEVMVNDGYFVHFFSPSQLQPLAKHAIFVLDVSGSMDGRKIEQLREAMEAILKDLKPQDYFSLVEFSGDVKVWNLDNPSDSPIFGSSPYLMYMLPPSHVDGPNEATTVKPPSKIPPAYKATEANIAKAKDIVKRMNAYGGTNIFEALKTGLEIAKLGVGQVNSSHPEDVPQPIILFLTDGDPTVGITTPSKITSGISELNNRPRAEVFSLAFGEGADIRFLRKLALANGGFARNIYEAADASTQLKDFYRGISSPLLANVTFRYVPEKVEEDSMTQLKFRTFFDGSELVVAGRTSDKGVQELNAEVSAVGEKGNHTFTAKPIAVDPPLTIYPFDEEGPLFNQTRAPRRVSMLERLWAYLTIKQLLDEQDALDASRDRSGEPDRFMPLPPPPPGIRVPQPPPPVALPAAASSVSTTASTPTSTAAADADALAALGNLTGIFKPEPKKRALYLALKYSFVTPLTSLVVVKPNETKATDAETVKPGDGDAGKFGFGGGLLGAPQYAMSKRVYVGAIGGMPGMPASGPSASAASAGSYYLPMRASGAAFPASLAFANSLMVGGGHLHHASPMGALQVQPPPLPAPLQPLTLEGDVRKKGYIPMDLSGPKASALSAAAPVAPALQQSMISLSSWRPSRPAAGFPGPPPPPPPPPAQPPRPTADEGDAAVAGLGVADRGFVALSAPAYANSLMYKLSAPTTVAPALAGTAAPHSVEAYEPIIETSSTEAATEPSAPQLMLNISEVEWLPKDALDKGEVSLPLGDNGTAKTYKVAYNQTESQPKQTCMSQHGTGSPNGVAGVCRHLSNCVISQVVSKIEDFKPYQCIMGDYLAICCPTDEDEANTTDIPKSSSPVTVR